VDLIVGNIQGDISFLPNASHDGELLFGPKEPVRSQGDEINVGDDAGPLVADWDGDGIADLLVGAGDGSVTFYKSSGNEGVPTLGAAVTLVPAVEEGSREIIKLDRDPTTGELVPPALDRSTIRPKVALYDWNGDRQLDLVVGDAVSTLGPEPVLTTDQEKERDDLERQQKEIGKAISKRFSEAEAEARRELRAPAVGNGDSDMQESVAEKTDEALSKDTRYRDLCTQAETIGKKLNPLKSNYATHGFVWVYLRSAEGSVVPNVVSKPGPPEGTLVVHVVAKETGSPLRSVRISLRPKNPQEGFTWTDVKKSKGTIHQSLRPDELGVVEFAVPLGQDFELSATDETDRMTRAEQDVPALLVSQKKGVCLEVKTQEDVVFCGRVVRSTDASPIPGARIQAVQAQSSFVSRDDEPSHEVWTKRTLSETVSDSDGRFTLRLASWKQPHVRIDADGSASRVIVPRTGHEMSESAQTITLAAPAALSAHVIDAAGNALIGASVSLSAPGYSLVTGGDEEDSFGGDYISLPDEQWKADVGADGRCTIKALLPATPLSVEIVQGEKVVRRIPDAFSLTAGELREIEWKIGGGCTLKGLAVDQDGKPVTDHEIWLKRGDAHEETYFQRYSNDDVVDRATTDREGRFVFSDVEAGKWQIGPAPVRGYGAPAGERAPASLVQVVDVAAVASQDVVLRVFRGLYIRGRVVSPKGDPVAHCYLHGGGDEAWLGAETQTEEDGTFVLGPVGAGVMTLLAHGEGGFASSDAVKAEPGQLGVVLRLKPGGKVRGRVIEAATGQGCRAELMLTPQNPRPGWFGSGMSTGTGEDGAFEFEGLEPGLYGFAAGTQDGRFGVVSSVSIDANVEAQEVVVPLSPGGILKLRYEGAQKWMSVKLTQGGVPVKWEQPIEPGKAVTLRGPSGTVVLELRSTLNEKPRLKQLTLAPGESKDVVLRDDD
jgi:hypothetical protein